MTDNIKKFIVALITGVGSWIVLSYFFFPIVPSVNSAELYFAETMVNMIPLKTLITTVFVLFSIFLYEQRQKKRIKAQEKTKTN